MSGIKGRSGVYVRTEKIKKSLKTRTSRKFSEKPSYSALHKWVYYHLGRPTECSYCGYRGYIEWASISHKAQRDLGDYIPLCVKCHRKYDLWSEKMWQSRRRNLEVIK